MTPTSFINVFRILLKLLQTNAPGGERIVLLSSQGKYQDLHLGHVLQQMFHLVLASILSLVRHVNLTLKVDI